LIATVLSSPRLTPKPAIVQEDIALAKVTAGGPAPVEPLAAICGVPSPRRRRGGPVRVGEAGGAVALDETRADRDQWREQAQKVTGLIED